MNLDDLDRLLEAEEEHFETTVRTSTPNYQRTYSERSNHYQAIPPKPQPQQELIPTDEQKKLRSHKTQMNGSTFFNSGFSLTSNGTRSRQ
jgi:hypothetical protein